MTDYELHKHIKKKYKHIKIKKILEVNLVVAVLSALIYIFRSTGQFTFINLIWSIISTALILNPLLFLFSYFRASLILVSKSNVEQLKFEKFKTNYIKNMDNNKK